MLRIALGAACAALLATGCAQGPAPTADPSPSTLRELPAGRVLGFRSSDGADAWRGIPYARPPVGALREENANVRPIRLGPGLLVFLDRMRRETFLRSWTSSMEQR